MWFTERKCLHFDSNFFSLKFVPKHLISNLSALFQVLAWHWIGDKTWKFISKYLRFIQENAFKNVTWNMCYIYILYKWYHMSKMLYLDGLVQERCNSIANALKLHLSCTNPPIYGNLLWRSFCWCGVVMGWRHNDRHLLAMLSVCFTVHEVPVVSPASGANGFCMLLVALSAREWVNVASRE